jgi:hypothetical protein
LDGDELKRALDSDSDIELIPAITDVVRSWENGPMLNETKIPRTESVQFQNQPRKS